MIPPLLVPASERAWRTSRVKREGRPAVAPANGLALFALQNADFCWSSSSSSTHTQTHNLAFQASPGSRKLPTTGVLQIFAINTNGSLHWAIYSNIDTTTNA